jgi:hypothetical protein
VNLVPVLTIKDNEEGGHAGDQKDDDVEASNVKSITF